MERIMTTIFIFYIYDEKHICIYARQKYKKMHLPKNKQQTNIVILDFFILSLETLG